MWRAVISSGCCAFVDSMHRQMSNPQPLMSSRLRNYSVYGVLAR